MKGFVPEKVDFAVKGITLLSIEEATALPQKVRGIQRRWWLRSAGRSPRFAAYVRTNGSVSGFGDQTYYEDLGVRPALTISNLSEVPADLYSKVRLFNREWTVISDSMILADFPISYRMFDETSSDYETSNVKKYLEGWLKRQLKSNK